MIAHILLREERQPGQVFPGPEIPGFKPSLAEALAVEIRFTPGVDQNGLQLLQLPRPTLVEGQMVLPLEPSGDAKVWRVFVCCPCRDDEGSKKPGDHGRVPLPFPGSKTGGVGRGSVTGGPVGCKHSASS